MKHLLKLLALSVALLPGFALATGEITGTFLTANNGTTSATVFVTSSSEFTSITDLGWQLDSGVTTGQVVFRQGDNRYDVASATSASGTVVWFANTGTNVSAGEYIIIYDDSLGSYLLRQTKAAATTSVTVTESIAVALTTSDKVWSVTSSSSRPVPSTTSQTVFAGPIWLPRNVPTAITLDGNTTACRLSISGVRSNYR